MHEAAALARDIHPFPNSKIQIWAQLHPLTQFERHSQPSPLLNLSHRDVSSITRVALTVLMTLKREWGPEDPLLCGPLLRLEADFGSALPVTPVPLRCAVRSHQTLTHTHRHRHISIHRYPSFTNTSCYAFSNRSSTQINIITDICVIIQSFTSPRAQHAEVWRWLTAVAAGQLFICGEGGGADVDEKAFFFWHLYLLMSS